jgi:oxygen-independent coproporphyrinogen-3 oxidase
MNKGFTGEAGLYVHVPFCRAICPYCDFYSVVPRSLQITQYIDSINNEIKLFKDSSYSKFSYGSLFFGGGTPSFIQTDELEQILNHIYSGFDISMDAEITIECNPNSLDKEKLNQYRVMGINRISLGVQSFNDEHLKTLGRIHDLDSALKSYENVRATGFDNVSIDMIYGIPGQSLKDWDRDLDNAIDLAPDHISAYNLIIEPNTPFGELYDKGELNPPADNVQEKMYLMLNEKLKANGYYRYEISNFAKDGYESIHNMKYWRYEPYLGLGPSAVSFDGKTRSKNVSDLKSHIENMKNENYISYEIETIDHSKAITEKIMMGLRLTEGISISELKNRYEYDILSEKADVLEKLSDSRLIEIIDNRLVIAEKGLYISNSIILDLI